LTNRLLFTSLTRDAQGQYHDHGLQDIERGEFWRLFTPALMHVNPIHILFNMMWLRYIGTLIEIRRGTMRLAILFLVSAAVSNYGQFIWMERMGEVGAAMGMSGVIYALFGYVWMKGTYQPEQRMAVSSANINIMILWLFFCMSGALGPIANAAHFVGLAVGIIFGLIGF
jgi:GlpG protein